MIAVKEVELILCGKNINYYGKLGYDIPRRKTRGGICVPRGTKIMVKIKDLQSGSNIKVPLKCDLCGLLHSTKYQDYLRYNHNGKTYCNKCSNTILLSGENNYWYGKGYLKTGENNPNWNPNLTDEDREATRHTPEYTEWIKKCMFVANYKSQISEKTTSLEVHHLNDWANHKEQRYNIDNGIVLTEEEHKAFHNWQRINYPKQPCTKEQFEEWNKNEIYKREYNGETLSTSRPVFCIEEDVSYKSVDEISLNWGCKPSQIYQCCNHIYKSVYGKHILWLDEYEKMSKEDIYKYLEENKPYDHVGIKVICLNTKIIYNSITEASIKSNYCDKSIIDCCKHKLKFTKNRKGAPCYWMYLDEYELLTEQQIIDILNSEKIICITTNEIFECTWVASEKYNISNGDISRCCRYERNYCGKLQDGTKLVWRYYKEFSKKYKNNSE